MTTERKQGLWLLAGVFLLANIVMFALFRSEQYEYQGGLGWDPGTYAKMVRGGLTQLVSHTQSKYYIQRILPSAIVTSVLYLTKQEATDHTIITTFTYINWAFLNMAVLFIVLSLRLLKRSYTTTVIAAFMAFFNILIIKYLLYSPVNTDALTFLFSAVLFYLYFAKRNALILVTTVLAGFTNPLLFYVGVLLFALPFGDSKRRSFHFAYLPAAQKVLPFLLILGIAGFHVLYHNSINIQEVVNESPTPTWLSMYPLSLGIVLLYVFIVTRTVLDSGAVPVILNNLSLKRILIALAMLLAGRFIYTSLASEVAGPLSIKGLVYNIMKQSVAYPFIFGFAHMNVLGVVVILIFLRFKSFMTHIVSLGSGAIVVFLSGLALSIGSESRQLAYLLPLLVIAVSMMLEPDGTTLRKRMLPIYIGIAGIGLFMTRFWYKINLAPCRGTPRSYPDQRLFINSGPWVNRESYFILISSATIGLAVIGLLMYNSRSAAKKAAYQEASN